MPVKKTTTKKTSVKKTPVKKVNAKKTVAKKVHAKDTVKTSSKTQNSTFDLKLDKCVAMMQKKCAFISKIMDLEIIKSILWSKVMNDTNTWVKKNLENISQVLWRLALVFWAILLLTTLSTMWRLFRYFGAWYIVLFILNIVYLIVWMVLWYGLIKMKKRVPYFVTFTVLFDIAYIVVASIIWGMWAISSPRSVIFYIVFMLYVLKNKSLFNK